MAGLRLRLSSAWCWARRSSFSLYDEYRGVRRKPLNGSATRLREFVDGFPRAFPGRVVVDDHDAPLRRMPTHEFQGGRRRFVVVGIEVRQGDRLPAVPRERLAEPALVVDDALGRDPG